MDSTLEDGLILESAASVNNPPVSGFTSLWLSTRMLNLVSSSAQVFDRNIPYGPSGDVKWAVDLDCC
jgi:hypothetical protein